MTTFPDALRAQLEADPALSRRGARILELLKARPSKRRDRRLARMEAHARAHLGYASEAKVDWADRSAGGSVNWGEILKTLLELLMKLLPLILGL